MKGISGSFLLIFGLVIFIISAQKDLSFWYVGLAGGMLIGGLTLMIDSKVDTTKEEIMEKVEDLENRTTDLENKFVDQDD